MKHEEVLNFLENESKKMELISDTKKEILTADFVFCEMSR